MSVEGKKRFLYFSAATGCKIQKEKHSLATKRASGKAPATVTYFVVTYRLIDNQQNAVMIVGHTGQTINSQTVVGTHSVTP